MHLSKISIIFCLAAILWVPSTLAGDLPAAQKAEIQHLLTYVAKSGCNFIRNGVEHTPLDAVKHINTKNDYFKDKIDSTEKFIELSASRSTITKRRYTIKCPGKEAMDSQKWLLEKLDMLRRETGK